MELQLQHQSFQYIYSRLISLRIDWSDLAVQETLESSPTPQIESSSLPCSAFFMVQLSHPLEAANFTI